MPIKLSLPAVATTPDPGVETRAVYVEERIESLAYANPPALLEQTLEAVRQLNQQPLKPALRIDLLDLHIRPYAFALEVRRTQEPAQTGTALARQRAVSRRLRLLSVAMALGYKQALSEAVERKSRFGIGRDTRAALQRSVLFSSLALLHCYDEYRPTEPRLWVETIALHEYAARSGIDGTRVTARVSDRIFSQPVADSFKRLCLTCLVDPYHLAYGELWTVYAAFGEYAPLAELRRPAPVKRAAGLFVVDPAMDRKPVPLAQVRGDLPSHCRLLDANPVLEALRVRHKAGGAREPLASHVLAAMIRALGLPPKRHSPREHTEDRVEVAAGLSTVHHFLGGGDLDDRPRTRRGGGMGSGDTTGLAGEQRLSYRHEPWTLINEGPGGVGILRRARPQTPLGVGELVGLQFPLRGDTGRDWSIGVVRWLNVASDDEVQAGVQALSEAAVPVLVHSEGFTDTITRIPRPALAVPAPGPQPGNTLITARGMFARGNMLRVSGPDRSWLVEALALSEGTAAFDRFTYRIVEEA